MASSRIGCVVIVLTAILQSCIASRILGVFASPVKSHVIIHMALAESLATRGHNVTVVTTIRVDASDSVRVIQVNNIDGMPPEVVKIMKRTASPPLANMKFIQTFSAALAPVHNESLNHPKMRDLMQNESFDLVILGYFFNDFELGVAAHFKCPVVVNWMVGPLRSVSNLVAQPMEWSYVPTLLSELTQPMDFASRMKNFVYTMYDIYLCHQMNKVMQKYYEYNFPPNKYPSLNEMRKNISLVLTNHHFSEGPISPLLPALIEIGGIQIKEKPDPIPSSIQEFLDGGVDGVIFFSFGSNYPTSSLKPHIIQAIIKVFSGLKQRVMMKWETDSPPINSSNILFRKWFPQDDILFHPNLRLFITHGGRGSIAETQYHGVPILGVPLFSDQVGNVDYAVKSGFGVRLDLVDLSERSFRNAIKEVLRNPVYRENIKRFSNIYSDRPMGPKDTAIFWIEYVIRHRGAKHMQSPAVHMNFFQYHGLDIFATLIVVFLVVCKLLVVLVAKPLKLLMRTKNTKGKIE